MPGQEREITVVSRLIGIFLVAFIFLVACVPLIPVNSDSSVCTVTEPEWVKPPADSAVSGTPDFGYYYVNDDRSIWVAAWWEGVEGNYINATGNGIKTGWFRPEGVDLIISGKRIDGDAPPLVAEVPCCYPTRFQATGLIFPTEGCWEIKAKAGESELAFTLWVDP